MKRVLLFATAAVLLLALACTGATEVVLFYEDGCPHCAHVEALLQEIEDAGGALTVRQYAVSSWEARDLLPRLLSAYGAEMGPVPLLFVANVAVVRDTFYRLDAAPVSLSGRAADLELKGIVEKAIAEDAASPLDRLPAAATEAVLVLAGDCPDCERLDQFVTGLQELHPELAVRRVSADEEEGQKLLDRLAKFYRVRGSIPALFVGDTVVVGGTMYPGRDKSRPSAFSDEDKALLTARVERAIEQKAMPPIEKLRVREKATLWAVIGSALLDSINPCDFAVMLLLLGRLLVIGKRQIGRAHV